MHRQIIFTGHEVTKAFNDVEHKKLHKIYDKIFGSESLPKSILLKSVKLTPKPV